MHRVMEEEGEDSQEVLWMAGRGGGSLWTGGGGAHRRGNEVGFVGLGAQKFQRRATTLAAGTAALLLLSACLPGGRKTGQETETTENQHTPLNEASEALPVPAPSSS